MSREYGYVRISTKDQHEDRQLIVMKDLGIREEFIFVDKASGKNFDRPEYMLLKRVLRDGDTLYIKSIDRFGRNKQEILAEWQWLIQQKIDIVVIDMPILDTRKYKGLEGVGQLITDLVLQILSWLAEEEIKTTKQRQSEGIEAAKLNGKHLGRPRIDFDSLTDEQKSIFRKYHLSWTKKEITAVQFMKLVGLKRSTFYKVANDYEGDRIFTL